MAGEKEEGKGEKDSTKDVAEALKSLITRLGDIFGVFDLSFFVAGAVCFGAVLFGVYIFYGSAPFHEINVKEWAGLHIAAVILACYVLGLVCFTAGRKAHAILPFSRKRYSGLRGMLRDFALLDHYDRHDRLRPKGKSETASMTREEREKARGEIERRAELLYTRLWAEARQSPKLAPSFNLLVRYWVMAAMCDGLAIAFAVWLALWGYWAIAGGGPGLPDARPPTQILWVVSLVLAFVVYCCIDEGRRYQKYQQSELLATLAYIHVPLEGAPEEGLGREDPSEAELLKAALLETAAGAPPMKPPPSGQ